MNFPEMPLEPKDNEILGYCAHCGEEVYKIDMAFLGEEGYLHRECMIDFFENKIGVDFLAEKLGYMLICGGVYV